MFTLSDTLANAGVSVRTYSPGDGKTRYRFFLNAPEGQTYFGPDNGMYTALGRKEAETFAAGYYFAIRNTQEKH